MKTPYICLSAQRFCFLFAHQPSQVWPEARYPSLQMQSSGDVLPGGEVWFSPGHGRHVLIPPGEASGLYVPGGQAAGKRPEKSIHVVPQSRITKILQTNWAGVGSSQTVAL
jgi:hypothetical protein